MRPKQATRSTAEFGTIRQLNDHSGAAHVLAQDRAGRCWHFREPDYGGPWEVEPVTMPKGTSPGPLAFTMDQHGDPIAFAVSGGGAVQAARWMCGRERWSRWAHLGGAGITHLTAVTQPRGVLLVGRTSRGELVALGLGEGGRRSGWAAIGKSCAGQPTAMLAASGGVVVLFRSEAGELVEIRQEAGGAFSQPQRISDSRLATDPIATVRADGTLLVVATAAAGALTATVGGPGGWRASDLLAGQPRHATDPGVSLLQSGAVVVTARSSDRTLLVKPEHGGWIDTEVAVPLLATLVRFKSGRTELLTPSWLRAAVTRVDLFTIQIDTLSPAPPLFEGDGLGLTYTLTNVTPKAATGEVTAWVSSNVPTYYSHDLKPAGPPAAGLAPGASVQGDFRLSDYQYLAPGTAHIGVMYRSYATPPKVVTIPVAGPGLGPEITIGVVDYVATDTRQEKIWQFDEAFPTDDPAVAAGPPQCSAGKPDLEAPVRSYNFVTLCRSVKAVVEPRTINEVVAIVSAAVAAGTRLRVIGAEHSANRQLCTEGTAIRTDHLQGAAPFRTGSLLLSMPRINYDADLSWPEGAPQPANPPRLVQFEGGTTVQVGPGMTMRNLMEWLDAQGWSLGYAVPGFREPTIGGAVATGTHGSSIVHSVVISSRVKWVLLVRPDGSVAEYSASTTDSDTWKALCCNLGFLGVVVQLRLAVESAFNLRVKVEWTTADALLNAAMPHHLIAGSDWGEMVWFPRGGDGGAPVMVLRGYRTDDAADPSVENRLLHPTIPVAESTLAQFVIDGMEASVCSGSDSRDWEVLRSDILEYVYPAFTAGDSLRGLLKVMMDVPPAIMTGLMGFLFAIPGVFPLIAPLLPILPIIAATTDPSEPEAVGRWHRMMSSDLAGTRPMQRDWEIFIPESQAKGVLAAAAQFFKANHVYLPLTGVFLRFAPAEDTTLVAHTVALPGNSAVGEAGMFFEMPVLLPEHMKCSDRDTYEQVYASFVELLVTQHGGRAHWGKNRSSLFQRQRIIGRYGYNLTRFREVVKRMDPAGTFANQYGVDMGLRWPASPLVPDNTETRGCVPG